MTCFPSKLLVMTGHDSKAAHITLTNSSACSHHQTMTVNAELSLS